MARPAVAAGYEVVLSNSRGPQTLKEPVNELGAGARAATAVEAAAAGDMVVVSTPPRAYSAVPVQLPSGNTSNYIRQRDGPIPDLYDGPLSSNEVLQRRLRGAHVVKVFNNITACTSADWPARLAPLTVAPCLSPAMTQPRRRR